MHSASTSFKIQQSFLAIRVLDEILTPILLQVGVTLCLPVTAGSDAGELERATHGIDRINVFLDSSMHGVIIADYDDSMLLMLEAETNNPSIMYTPGKPDNLLLMALLKEKLTAIAGNDLLVKDLTLSSTDSSIEVYYNMEQDDGGYRQLPGIEYLGAKTVLREPWWERPTVECCDYITDDAAACEYITENDPLQYIGRPEEEAQIIVIDKWKNTDE